MSATEAIIVTLLVQLMLLPIFNAMLRMLKARKLLNDATNPRQRAYYHRLYGNALRFRWWHSVLLLLGAIGLALMMVWWRSA